MTTETVVGSSAELLAHLGSLAAETDAHVARLSAEYRDIIAAADSRCDEINEQWQRHRLLAAAVRKRAALLLADLNRQEKRGLP